MEKPIEEEKTVQTRREEILDHLRKVLPDVFPRKYVETLLGGFLKASTLANLDSQGLGPGGTAFGRNVLYTKICFIEWFENRCLKSASGQFALPRKKKSRAAENMKFIKRP